MEQPVSLDIPTLNQFLERIGSYTTDLIFNPGDLQAIYHYTDLHGLRGVIESHDLWLTNSRYSNDDEELTHGYRVVAEVIDQQLAVKGPANRGRKRFLRHVQEMIAQPTQEGIYICCFCQEGDLLSQWRGYGANGTGVCIGFRPGGFDHITGPDSPPRGLIRLWPVIYERDRQENIVREALLFAFDELGSLTLIERARRAVEAISFFIPTFKNEDFEEEREIRLIFTPNPDFAHQPSFRVARNMLVPYYSLRELAGNPPTPHPLPIQEVIIGPSMNKGVNAESVRLLLAKAQYSVPVIVSSTPYRG